MVSKFVVGSDEQDIQLNPIELIRSSDSFTNLETTNIRFFRETEFVYLLLCTVNINNNIQFRRLVVSKYSRNHMMIIRQLT